MKKICLYRLLTKCEFFQFCISTADVLSDGACDYHELPVTLKMLCSSRVPCSHSSHNLSACQRSDSIAEFKRPVTRCHFIQFCLFWNIKIGKITSVYSKTPHIRLSRDRARVGTQKNSDIQRSIKLLVQVVQHLYYEYLKQTQQLRASWKSRK